MKRSHAAPLTDLGTFGPQIRSGDSSPFSKRKTQSQKTKSVARINQIVVSATATASYVAEEEDEGTTTIGNESSRPPSVKGSTPKARTLLRSQTAPEGLKQPRNKDDVGSTRGPVVLGMSATLQDIPSRPISVQWPRVAIPPTPLSRIRNGDQDHGDEIDSKSPPAPLVKYPHGSRPYGAMIDSDDVLKLCSRLGMERNEVWALHKKFNEEETDNTDTITFSSFFYIIHEEKRALTKSLLRLAGLSSSTQTRLTFDEFLRCVVTFASYSEPEVLHFFFQVYSDNTSAKPRGPWQPSMVESDLMKLGEDLQVLKSAFAGNVRNATSEGASGATLGTSFEGIWTFHEFERFSRLHPVAFYPLFQIQRNVRRAGGLGDAYWSQKTAEKAQVQQLLLYMRQNHGFQPPLPLKDRVWRFVLQRPTTQTRVRELAKKLYTG